MHSGEGDEFRVKEALLPDEVVDGFDLSRPGGGGADQVPVHADLLPAFQQGFRRAVAAAPHGLVVEAPDGGHRFGGDLFREDMGMGVDDAFFLQNAASFL